MAELRFDDLEAFRDDERDDLTGHHFHLRQFEEMITLEKAQEPATPAATPKDSVVATSDSFVEEVDVRRIQAPPDFSSLTRHLQEQKITAAPILAPREAPPANPASLRPHRPSTGYLRQRAMTPLGESLDEDDYKERPQKLERNPIHRALLAWSRQLTWKGWD